MVPRSFPVSASAEGIARCLQLLMEEAVSMQLTRTTSALAHAILVVASEGELVELQVPPSICDLACSSASETH